jgi:anti-anti-sigma factor
MNARSSASTPDPLRSSPPRAIEISGVQVHARCHHVANVVTITGDIGAANVDQIAAYCGRLTLAGNPIVLDLTGVQRFCASCLRLVNILSAQCNNAGVELVVAAHGAVLDGLDACGESVSTATSAPVALGYFTEAVRARRQLLLPFFAKTA